MRGTLAGALSGAMALLVLHAFVARANQAQLQGIVSVAVGVVDRFLNPATPAIADRSGGSSSAPSPTAAAGSGSPYTTRGITPPSSVVAPGLLSQTQTVYPAPTSR